MTTTIGLAAKRWFLRIPWIFLLMFASVRLLHLYWFKTPNSVARNTLSLKTLDGNPLPAKLMAGKALVLNFWAPWCPPCRLEIPWLQHIQDVNAANILVIGVVADSSQYQQARTFMLARGITYPLVRDTPSVDQPFGGVSALPTTFYIARSGVVVRSTRGVIPEFLMVRYAHDAANK